MISQASFSNLLRLFQMRPVNSFFLRLRLGPRWGLMTLCAMLGIGLCAQSVAAANNAAAAQAVTIESFHLQSRELVDLELARDGALTILVSSPGTSAPGIYRWGADDARPTKLCDIASPSFFSFDRRVIIERERGNPSRVRLYRPKDCALLAQLDIEGRVLDIDVRGQRIAAAVRLADRGLALRLLDRQGHVLASTSVGRNVEMGFSPDGRMLLNFDLSDPGPRAWSNPNLAAVTLPKWLNDPEVTFVAGVPFVKRYANNTLTVARWPTGIAQHAIDATASTRIRALSANGAIALVHEFKQQRDVLEWVELRTGSRIALAQGSQRASIDHAAISPDAKRIAWSFRSGTSQQVVVQRRPAPHATLSEGEPSAPDFGQAADDTSTMSEPVFTNTPTTPTLAPVAPSLAPAQSAASPLAPAPSIVPRPSTAPDAESPTPASPTPPAK